ncbi:hypothetical protein DFH28DRAFT_910274 [Melampsora americana]|nr:hypothetical protein DFH28DRAFT_910274 [Melampsora americana]
MQDVVLPTGITRLPSNLGESKHGKLKGAQWHSLYSYVIPLIVLEIFVVDVDDIEVASNRGRILYNIADLVQCTNIVSAKWVTEKDADMFSFFYGQYHKNWKHIFGELKLKPNHHYALHIPDQMRRWGPLTEMDRTMLRRFCQLQRLLGNHGIDDYVSLEDEYPRKSKRIRNRIELQDYEYEALLCHLRKTMPDIRDYRHLPHPAKSKVLHADAVPKPFLKVSQYVSISVLKPNNCVKYEMAGKACYGMVRQIYQLTDPVGCLRTEVWINPIENLFPKDLASSSKNFRYLLHLMKCVLGRIEDRCMFLSPDRVVAVAAYRLLPNDTFSIDEGGIILLPFDHKSQNYDM